VARHRCAESLNGFVAFRQTVIVQFRLLGIADQNQISDAAAARESEPFAIARSIEEQDTVRFEISVGDSHHR
jgi:hypothetical protein